MDERKSQEMATRVPDKYGKKQHFFWHYVNVMIELCDENVEDE